MTARQQAHPPDHGDDGMVTMCIGGGQGIAAIFERL